MFAQLPSATDHRFIISSFYRVYAMHRSPCLRHFCPSDLSSHVPLHVQGEVVGPGERPFTQVTLKRPVSGVLPEVTRKLVGASELPAAAFPAAVIWFLSCVRPEVRLQVGALGVGLSTAGESAGVCRSPFPRPGPSTPLWLDVHHFQRGGRWSEQNPLAGGRLRLHAHGRVLSEHARKLVMVVRAGEWELHPSMGVRVSPGRAVVVEVLRERQRGRVAHLGLALGAHQVVRTERRRHAADCSLRGISQSRLLLV